MNKLLPDKWHQVGHHLGECWHKYHMIYVNIPKNATSTVKGYLITDGWTNSKKAIEGEMYFTVLRDPINRWITGMAQFIVNNKIELTPYIVDKIFDKITHDDHTELQTYFLQPFDLNKFIFFKCDVNLRNNLEKFFLEQGHDYTKIEFEDLNVSYGLHKEIADNLKSIIENNGHYLDKLNEHFRPDYYLFNRVKFYN